MQAHKSWLTICVATAVLAGCGGSNKDPEPGPDAATPTATETAVNVVQPGAPGEPTKQLPPGTTPVPIEPVEADFEFMQKMITHHDQALVMTGWVPDRAGDEGIKLLAKRMEISQKDEVEQMKQWLKKHGREPAPHEHSADEMPGMLTPEQLEQLQGAEGKQFEKLFLEFMTQHHQGALQMIADLYSAGGAGETEIQQFAMHVDSDQSIEIQRMAELLKKY
jgi:uncharacterized protein (DUF305 family)